MGLAALFQGKTSIKTKYPSITVGVSVFLFFFFMCVVGMLEGMQIAFFAVAKLPPSERGTSMFGKMTCDLLFKGNGANLPGFMIGRQLTVVASFFLVGSITSMLASITWQLAASAFPIAFLNNPFTYILLVIALFLEFIGLCAGAWVCARIMKTVLKYQYDEVYVGTPEERAANNHADKDLPRGGFFVCGSHDALDGPIEGIGGDNENAVEQDV